MAAITLKDQNTLVPTKDYPLATYPFEKFNPVQSRIIEIYQEDCNIIVAAATSSGKAQPLDAKILTPNGFVEMQDIKKGDYVIGSQGLPIMVKNIFPQGKKEVYKITFSDKTSTECCEDHLWAVRTKYDKCRNRPFRIKSLKDLINNLKNKKGENKWHIPLINQNFNDDNINSNLPLHPYVLGVLLGDGGIKYQVILSSADKFILKNFKKHLPKKVKVKYNSQYDYIVSKGMRETHSYTNGTHGGGAVATNLVKKLLKELKLFGVGSENKFIPEIYLYASPQERLELLRGLMDTDGNSNGKNGCAEFSSCSRKLACGVLQLIRSFGACACLREGPTSYISKKTGKRVKCKKRYRVSVNIGNINPFKLPRKAKKQGLNLEKGRNKYIEKIEKIGYKKCQCISVDSADNLYVTDDYILTHNTITSEIVAAHEVKKGKIVYLAPMKALAKEKIDDWSKEDHHFAKCKKAICTGDYRLTPERKKELEEADLIMMTNEMLNSRVRNYASEHNDWLKDVSLVINDEFHILGTTRGPHTEVGIMKFCDINPKARIIGLSATMPNVEEIANWVETLNNKKTYLIDSEYRPCPLGIHWETYFDKGTYLQVEKNKVEAAIDIVQLFPKDKFILFVHTKNTGDLLIKSLKEAGIECAYHNADQEKESREKIENEFKKGNKLRVIVATSTLAWGCNMPARRVVIVGVHRGLEEVEQFDIKQECGRSGRVGLDPRGDAYILVPERKSDYHIDRLSKPALIRSRLLDCIGGEKEEDSANEAKKEQHYKVLAFHLVSEIHHGDVRTKEDVKKWFSKTLAYYQLRKISENVLDSTISDLKKFGAIKEEDGILKCTSVGMVASMFYYSPFDVADLRRNFRFLFDNNYHGNDIALSMALGATDSNKMQYVTKAELEEMETYAFQVKKMYNDMFSPSAVKGGYANYVLLTGMNPGPFTAMSRGIQQDFERTLMVLNALDSMSCQWNKRGWFNTLGIRMSYGVPIELVPLCRLPNIGKVRAERLWNANLRTYESICSNPDHVGRILNLKSDKVQEIIDEARRKI